jgi:hypothetical protein
MDSSLLALGIRKAGKEESMNIYLAMIKDHRKYALPLFIHTLPENTGP